MPTVEDIQNEIRPLLHKKLVNGKILLQDCKLVDENSRRSPAYSDPMYVPFYYHLGKFVTPKAMVSLSFNLGLLEKCFFMSCKSVEYLLAFRNRDERVYFSPRMGFYNIRRSYKGHFDYLESSARELGLEQRLSSRKWDMVMLNEEFNYDDMLYSLELSWQNMSSGGIIVVDNATDIKPIKQAFQAFADSVGREPAVFPTRYGTGILMR